MHREHLFNWGAFSEQPWAEGSSPGPVTTADRYPESYGEKLAAPSLRRRFEQTRFPPGLCAVAGLRHELEPVLTEKHLIADEEGRRTASGQWPQLQFRRLRKLCATTEWRERVQVTSEPWRSCLSRAVVPSSLASWPFRLFSLPARTRIACPQDAWPRWRGRGGPACGSRPSP